MQDLFGNETSPPRKPVNKIKRNWENRFQRWSNRNMLYNDTSPLGKCGYGEICGYCDLSKGRPCVKALNALLLEKRMTPDYAKLTYKDAWNGEF